MHTEASPSWSAFHASQEETLATATTTLCLLPLFQEDTATVAMVRHALAVIKNVVDLVNPGQVPVVTVEDKFLIMFGGLHIAGGSEANTKW